MSVLDSLELIVLATFIVINGSNAAALVLSARTMVMRDRRISELEEKVLTRAATYIPVTFVIPAYNEEATIVSSLRGLLSMHYPEFEVVVANDGSKDTTLDELKREFALAPCEPSPRSFAPHAEVKSAWRSVTHPNLMVLDKENGGRADAINAALEQARFPLVVLTDADSLIDPMALMRAGARFLDTPELVGLGGTIRVVNEADVKDGAVRQARTPRNMLARLQLLEYVRAFVAARVAMSHVGCLLSISGAFGIFRRIALLEVGGLRTDTVGEDFELTIRLHRHYRDKGVPYRLEFMVDPVCWTQVPDRAKVLRSQRDRWHRGLLESLWMPRHVLQPALRPDRHGGAALRVLRRRYHPDPRVLRLPPHNRPRHHRPPEHAVRSGVPGAVGVVRDARRARRRGPRPDLAALVEAAVGPLQAAQRRGHRACGTGRGWRSCGSWPCSGCAVVGVSGAP